MKNTFLSLAFVAATTLFVGSCKKDDSAATSTATTSYSPLTAGTNWTYKYTENSSAPQVFVLTVTSKDTVASGRTYKVVTRTNGGNNYIGQNGNDYYRFASIPQAGLQNFEELYLKDNLDVNGKWSSTAKIPFGGFTINATLNYTIKGKGESRTVGAQSFDKVVHVRLDIVLDAFGSVGGGDFYYQQGVGMIESNILVTDPTGGSYSSKQELTAFQIK